MFQSDFCKLKTVFSSTLPILATGVLSALTLVGCHSSRNTPSSSASSAAVTGDTIRVGEISSLTGSESTFGISTHQGIELAIQTINAAGGIHGKKIQLITMDDQSKPEEAATAATKLITQDKVIALLGEVASSRSLAMAPIAQQYKIPMITPSSTNPKVTEVGNYIFRTCYIDPFQGFVMAKFVTDQLKLTKAAVLRDIKNDYSVGLADTFVESFKKMGGQILADQSYSNGDIDFKAQLTAIRGLKPDVIYVPGYYGDVGLIGRQARELGISVPLLGGDGWDSPKLKEIAGRNLDGSYLSNHYSAEDQSPLVQNFIQKYQATYGSVPDALATLGYDAMNLLADAMKRSPSLTTSNIRDALATTQAFEAVSGKLTFDAKRNPQKSAVILKVVNGGQFQYQTTVQP